jgi:hypothetical protein
VRGAPKTDLLAPAAGRRFRAFAAKLVPGARWIFRPTRSRRLLAADDAASRPLSYGVSPKQAALKDQRYHRGVNLARAESSRVRVRGAPKTDLLAPAAGRRFRAFAAKLVPGARWIFRPTRSRRLLAADDAASRPLSYGVSPKQAALKDQRYHRGVNLARAESSRVRVRGAPKTDLLAPAAGRRFRAFAAKLVPGARWIFRPTRSRRLLAADDAASRPLSYGVSPKQAALKDQRYHRGVNLARAESSRVRVRGAPKTDLLAPAAGRRFRAFAAKLVPGARWIFRPTRSRRLLAADDAASRPLSYGVSPKQAALKDQRYHRGVNLARAESSRVRVRGAPKTDLLAPAAGRRFRAFAAKLVPGARWIFRPTRSRRLLAADDAASRPLSYGVSPKQAALKDQRYHRGVNLARAESSRVRVRGAPKTDLLAPAAGRRFRAFAAKLVPGARWIFRPTRSRRLLAADDAASRPLSYGVSPKQAALKDQRYHRGVNLARAESSRVRVRGAPKTDLLAPAAGRRFRAFAAKLVPGARWIFRPTRSRRLLAADDAASRPLSYGVSPKQAALKDQRYHRGVNLARAESSRVRVRGAPKTDLLAPAAGRRFRAFAAKLVPGARWIFRPTRSRRLLAADDAASRPLSYGVSPKQAALKDQRYHRGVNLARAESSRVRVRGAPKTDLLAPAAGRRFRAFAAKLVPGARWIFRPTRSRRLLAADDAASRPLSYGVSPKQAALKDQRYHRGVNLARAESSRVRVRGAPKTDLLAPAAGRRFRAFAAKLVPGARWIFRPTRSRRLLAADDAASRPLSYGVSPKQAALKDQRYHRGVNLARAESSRVRVRGAPKTDLLAPAAGRRFRAFAAKLVPGARWIFRPTRSRRLLAADDAASRPLSYGVSPKQAALKDQRYHRGVNLARAESSRVRVRGAPKTDLLAPAAGRRFRAFAAKLVPGARWI